MADFFEQMGQVAIDLLKPSDQGGLGASTGSIKYVRIGSGPPPANPWEPNPEPERMEMDIQGQSFGIGKELVGTEIDNTTLVASDQYVITPVLRQGFGIDDWWTYYFVPVGMEEVNVTHALEMDGVALIILSVEKIPAVGAASALRFIVRR